MNWLTSVTGEDAVQSAIIRTIRKLRKASQPEIMRYFNLNYPELIERADGSVVQAYLDLCVMDKRLKISEGTHGAVYEMIR